MDTETFFSEDYNAARALFLAACASRGIGVTPFPHPGRGPHGEALYADVAVLGPANAQRLLVLNSGTHGVEGFCGSAALSAFLHAGEETLNTKVVLVHAINPHGFAWLRRTNEDNIDLNRNFVEHHRDPIQSPGYEELHPVLAPRTWNAGTEADIRRFLEERVRRDGPLAVQAAICQGQYAHRDGIFYGGRAPAWSNRVFREILGHHAADVTRALLLDFHTGLGEYGACELITGVPPHAEVLAAFRAPVTSAKLGTAAGPALRGTIGMAFRDTLAAERVESFTVEFGTAPIMDVLMALLADNWLHAHGDPKGLGAVETKNLIRQRFYPDNPSWRATVLSSSQQTIHDALRFLAGSGAI